MKLTILGMNVGLQTRLVKCNIVFHFERLEEILAGGGQIWKPTLHVLMETVVHHSDEVDKMFKKLPNCKAKECDFNSVLSFF